MVSVPLIHHGPMLSCVVLVCVTAGFVVPTADLSAAPPAQVCYRLAKAPKIDGDLADWPQLPVIFLGRQEHVVSGDWGGGP